jgi:uncharacterized surface protein with fasciclin (FAS1) repeats
MKKSFTLVAVCTTVLLTACAGTMKTSASASGGNTAASLPPMSASGSTTLPAAGSASGTKMVGGAAMLPTRDIVDNAVNSKDHTTLVAAVKAAGLVDTLKGAGPFTVFAPTNDAFTALPSGTVDTLLKPESKAALTKVLTYHVVPGRLDGAALAQQIRAGNGKAMLKTASGGNLTASMSGSNVVITDDKGGAATVTIADVYQSNGVIHVVNKVLLPS